MQALEHVDEPSRASGLPVWVIWATLPVALALGVVAGVGFAVFTTPDLPPPVSTPALPQAKTTLPIAPPISANPLPDSGSVLTARPSTTDFSIPLRPLIPLENGGLGGAPDPGEASLPAAAAPPSDPVQLKVALSQRFNAVRVGTIALEGIEYQQMRNIGLSTSMVGMISVKQYSAWVQALEHQPEALRAWLQSAARLALPVTSRERIFLAWSVVDLLDQPPVGFAPHEVTPVTDGTVTRYLVIRQLACTYSHTETNVDLRTRESLTVASQQGRLDGGPWTTYTPVIRFDNTDLYRPPGLAGMRAKP